MEKEKEEYITTLTCFDENKNESRKVKHWSVIMRENRCKNRKETYKELKCTNDLEKKTDAETKKKSNVC